MSVSQEVKGNALKVYLYLLRHGPSELRDVQRGVGLSSASLASYHLGKLSEAGFVMQNEHGKYLAVKEASDRVLEGYSKMGPAVVPQLFFFTLLFTILTAFFSFEVLYASGSTMYLVAVSAVMVIVFWYETVILFALLFVSTWSVSVRIPLVKAWNGTIYINPDGSVDPPSAPIHKNGDTYTLTDNIITTGDGIIIKRNSTTFDGNEYTIQGSSGGNGIDLSVTSYVTVKNASIQGFFVGIFAPQSHYDTISGNTIAQNSYLGVWLDSSSNNNIIGNNIQQNDVYGIWLTSSWDNNIYHNNFVNNAGQVYTESINVWDAGYPSGGNYWSDYSGADSFCGLYQNETGSDGIGDDPYVINPQNLDSYPLMSQYPCIHAIAVQDVEAFPVGKTVVGQGFTVRVNVTVINQGHFVETFNVTAYANTAVIKTLENITLSSEDLTTVTLVWNTSGFTRGNYTLSAVAGAVPGEAYTADNSLADGVILVSFVGDVNHDGKVRVDDVLAVASRYGTNYGGPPNSIGFYYSANCDITDDLKIRVDDVLAAATHYGQGP
jgi:parallel beta-helix repeat protein